MKNLFDRAKLFFSKDREFRSALYAIMGFYPHNIDLYRTAFAHKSQEYRSKRLGNKPLNNERLEFLGDAVLETVVSDIVFRHFPNKREGFLTNTRSKIVSRESLGALAKELGIDRLIQSQTSGRSQKSYLPGNTFEALMGAIYLDRGFRYAYQFIEQRIIGAALDLKAVAEKEVNFKSKLLEWCQKNKIRLDLKEKGGQGNNEQFHTTIVIEGLYAGDGRGLSKKESHQSAAKEALTRMRREVDFIDQIFRAKEKRTAMEANEVFCLPKIAEIEEELAKEGATPRKERNKKESKERKEREIKREEKREEKQEEKQETKGTKKNEKKSEKNAKQERPESSSRKEQNTAAQEPAVSDTLNEERPKRERKERKERSERSEQAEQRAERSERREKPAQPEAAEKAVGSTQAPAQADTAIASQPTIVAAEEQTATTTEHSSKATNNAHRHKVAAVATPLVQVVEALETAHSSHPEEKEARNIKSASRTEQVVPAQSTTVAGQEPCPTEQTFSEACAAPVVACEETTPAPVVDSSTQPLQSTASTAPIELLPPHEEAAQEAPAGRVQQEKLQSGEEAIETPSTPSTPAAATTIAQPSTSNKNAPTRKIKLAYPWPVAVEEEEEDAAQGEPVAAAESATSQEETTLTESAPLTVLPPVEDAATESEKSEKPRKGRRAGTRQNASAFTNTTLPPAEQSHRAEKHERKLQEAREQRAIERARKLLGEEEIVENPIVEIALEPQSSLQETPASNDERSEKNARRRRGGRRGGKKRGGDAAQTAASSQQPQSTDASRHPNSEASLPEP